MVGDGLAQPIAELDVAAPKSSFEGKDFQSSGNPVGSLR
jgi:hypothetical protein